MHQTVDAERSIRRILAAPDAWMALGTVADRLRSEAEGLDEALSGLSSALADDVRKLLEAARNAEVSITQVRALIEAGDFDVLGEQLASFADDAHVLNGVVRRLRASKQPITLVATNVLADVHKVQEVKTELKRVLATRIAAVVADAGCGKTHLSAAVCAPRENIPSGILLFGADLHAGHTLNDLAGTVVIHGKPVASFEALAAAANAAGERAGRRIPIVIDGLNEAEDPRDWRPALASLDVVLQDHPYVCVICTLRSAFADDALPERITQLDIPHFEHDTVSAVRKYFGYYRIDPADAALPWALLQHPLTLRMFCEVTNSERKKTVGVERMPESFAALVEMYLDQVALRICELSPRVRRYYASDVRSALSQIGTALWEEKTRSIGQSDLRSCLKDDARPWSESIVRLLEDEGVLIRHADFVSSAGREAIVFDAMAGQVIADAILDKHGGSGFQSWLDDPHTRKMLWGEYSDRHPLAEDIVHALVGLAPRRLGRRQLWQFLSGDGRSKALHQAAWLDSRYLDADTVSQLATLVLDEPGHRKDLLTRLWHLRAANGHPLNAEFLDCVLRSASIADRDLRWTEWIRANHEKVIEDLQRLSDKWSTSDALTDADRLRVRWVIWLLTSTVRVLRDHATRALYAFGCRDPAGMFAMTLESLTVNDPYVPERMLAAAYGVAMSLWADPAGDELRTHLPTFARAIIDAMWVPGAPHSTCHALMQDYSMGVVEVARLIDPSCASGPEGKHLQRPLSHVPSPFRPLSRIPKSVKAAADYAIHMDFGNYTIGGLIPNRGNYDFHNQDYEKVRSQIECRIVDLGYSPGRFEDTDRRIADLAWRVHSRVPHTDRYGKKYSWIAFFEMYGLRRAKSRLSDWHDDERSPDADIDPSFPAEAPTWWPDLADVFTASPTDIRGWLTVGAVPDYSHLLQHELFEGEHGPWILLDGYIEQSCNHDGRRVFTFLRGILVSRSKVGALLEAFNSTGYPGNHAIPDGGSDYYTFAGEIPWSHRYASGLRDRRGKAKRHLERALRRYGPTPSEGIRVEIPIHNYAWESHHSELNQAGGATVLAPALFERCGLVNRRGTWDMFDRTGRRGSIYRRWKNAGDRYRSEVLYLREDLLADYLSVTRQVLVWLMWGERGFDHDTFRQHETEIREAHVGYSFIHRKGVQWVP
ncbi:MAG: hypothetical protein J5J06_09515 [Phycisphaerae bacterium]|nr:hypothetical protein [Phycisphaerae bacterium]